MRARPNCTKTWLIEHEFSGSRTKYTIGGYDRGGAPGDSIPDWLRYGRLSLTHARAIAGNGKDARRAYAPNLAAKAPSVMFSAISSCGIST